MKQLAILLTLGLFLNNFSYAQSLLTDAQVSWAIDRGLRAKPREIGLRLNDAQTAFFSGMVCRTCGTSGYTIYVYTAESWVELQALKAREEMMPFSLEQVTPEMRLPYLHVLALPSTADYITGTGLSMASSVHRVVLSSTDRSDTVQPLTSTNGTVEDNSALRSFTYSSAGATFKLSDVERLRQQDKNREFFIVVVGDRQNKFFKVKSRFFKQLYEHRNQPDLSRSELVNTAAKIDNPAPASLRSSTPTWSAGYLVPGAIVEPDTSKPNDTPSTLQPSTPSPLRSGGVWGLSGANWAQGGVKGVQIIEVLEDSSAELAGLHVGNVITHVNGRRIHNTQELAEALAQNYPDGRITLNYIFKSNIGWMPTETVATIAK